MLRRKRIGGGGLRALWREDSGGRGREVIDCG